MAKAGILDLHLLEAMNEGARSAAQETCDELFGGFFQDGEIGRIEDSVAHMDSRAFSAFVDKLAELSCHSKRLPAVEIFDQAFLIEIACNSEAVINDDDSICVSGEKLPRSSYRLVYPGDFARAVFGKRNERLHVHYPSVTEKLEQIGFGSGTLRGQIVCAWCSSSNKELYRVYERLLLMFYPEAISHDLHGETLIKAPFIVGKIIPSFEEFSEEIDFIATIKPLVLNSLKAQKSPD